MKLSTRLNRLQHGSDGRCRLCGGAASRPLLGTDPEWGELQGRIVVALAGNPAAQAAVLEAIRR